MDAIVLELLDKETLDREQVQTIIKQVEEKTFNFEAIREKVRLLKEKLDKKENSIASTIAA